MRDFNFYLPAEKLYSPKNNTKTGYSDLYGARKVLKNYCRANYSSYFEDVYVAHGTTPPWETITWPHLIKGLDVSRYFVVRKDESQMLRAIGKIAYPIGLPIIYLPTFNIERFENSLLVMPPHLLEDYSFDDQNRKTREYVDYINSIRDDFEIITVVINRICYDKGFWKDEFEKIGLKVIIGANKHDENALIRQKLLFQRHSHLTTAGWGSHVAYGLHFGCITSIIGPDLSVSHENLMKDYRDKNIVDYLKSEYIEIDKMYWLNRLYVKHPKEGLSDKNMGDFYVGINHKKEPLELAKLLDWKVKGYMKFIKNVYYYFYGELELRK